jgi:sialic acid synthase SpsE
MKDVFKKAKSLLKLVSESGANVAKFQNIHGSTLVNPKLDVQRG